jgi:hypothetical protein
MVKSKKEKNNSEKKTKTASIMKKGKKFEITLRFFS